MTSPLREARRSGVTLKYMVDKGGDYVDIELTK